MRIAFISLYNFAPWGGSEDLWVQTAAFAARAGHHVLASVYDFGTDTSPKILKLKEDGVILHFRPKVGYQKGIGRKFKLFYQNRITFLDRRYTRIFNFKPEVIFINDPGTFIYVRSYDRLQELIRRKEIPYILVCKLTPDYGSTIDSLLRKKAQEIFSKARKSLFVSHRMLHNVERYLALKLENAMVVQNPVNLPDFEKVPLPKDPIVHFAVVAHLGAAQKGQHILLDILSRPYWKEKHWQLNLYGEGGDKDYLTELANMYGISSRVVFHGRSENIKSVWANNHIGLFPSTSEGMPKAVIEAMVCGRAVVVTDIGGIPEVVRDEVSGFIAEAPSAESFNKALKRAWSVKERWKDMGEDAHREVMDWIQQRPEEVLLKTITGEVRE